MTVDILMTMKVRSAEQEKMLPVPSEPDAVVWRDEDTGYFRMVRRPMHTGVLCGYVGVPKTHSLYGKIDEEFDVHWGVTFCDLGTPSSRSLEPCTHVDEKMKRTPFYETESGEKFWWVGFDCGHCDDLLPFFDFGEFGAMMHAEKCTYKSLSYVMDECKQLAMQIYNRYERVAR